VTLRPLGHLADQFVAGPLDFKHGCPLLDSIRQVKEYPVAG
jgi:hypothetical protein